MSVAEWVPLVRGDWGLERLGSPATHRVVSYSARLSNVLEDIPANEKPVYNFLSLETNSIIH